MNYLEVSQALATYVDPDAVSVYDGHISIVGLIMVRSTAASFAQTLLL